MSRSESSRSGIRSGGASDADRVGAACVDAAAAGELQRRDLFGIRRVRPLRPVRAGVLTDVPIRHAPKGERDMVRLASGVAPGVRAPERSPAAGAIYEIRRPPRFSHLAARIGEPATDRQKS
jgi:hypothetical protein